MRRLRLALCSKVDIANESERTIGLIIWFWIVIASLLISYGQNYYIKKVRSNRVDQTDNPEKNTSLNPIQNFKNVIFFLSYKTKEHDSDELIQSVRMGRRIEIFYLVQLVLVAILCLYIFR
jgi:hypothetical protein